MHALLALLLLPLFALANPPLESSDYRLLRLPSEDKGELVKWGSPRLGTPALVTYAVLKRAAEPGLTIGDCRELLPAAALLKKLSLTDAQFEKEVAAGLALWEAAAGIRFVRTEDERRADFLIGVSAKNLDFTYARVGLHLAEGNGGEARMISKAAICLDDNEPWSLAESHRKGPLALSFRMAIAHEAGHVLGLNHPRNKSMFMHGAQLGLDSLQSGDIEGARILYGR